MAFTKADGDTELYAECELFDVSEELGIYHVSRDGWTINANTSIYMYYDADHADNNTYIGDVGSRTEVWDGNFVGVWHLREATTTLVDSITNYNLTKRAGDEPDDVTAKVGIGQSYDNTDDYAQRDAVSPVTNAWTVEGCVNFNNAAGDEYIFRLRPSAGDANEIRIRAADNSNGVKIAFMAIDENGSGTGYKYYFGNTTVTTSTWYHYMVTWDGTNLKLYLNGSEDTPYDKTVKDDAVTMTNTSRRLNIGSYWDGGQPVDGIIDETSLSDTTRSAAWAKASYNSSWDSLLTYGSEETEAVEVNAIFFGANF